MGYLGPERSPWDLHTKDYREPQQAPELGMQESKKAVAVIGCPIEDLPWRAGFLSLGKSSDLIFPRCAVERW